MMDSNAASKETPNEQGGSRSQLGLDGGVGSTVRQLLDEHRYGEAVSAACTGGMEWIGCALDERLIDVAREMMLDNDEDVACEAMQALSLFIAKRPDEVWQHTMSALRAISADRAPFVGAILLEHLLEVRFDTYMGLLECEAEQANDALRVAICCCWFFGTDALQHARLERLQRLCSKVFTHQRVSH